MTLAIRKNSDSDLLLLGGVPKRTGVKSMTEPKRPAKVPQESKTKFAGIAPQKLFPKNDSREEEFATDVPKFRQAIRKNPRSVMFREVFERTCASFQIEALRPCFKLISVNRPLI